MKTFQDLYVYLNGAAIEDLIAAMTKHCIGPWVRAKEREARSDFVGEPVYCFEHSETDGLPGAGLSLFSRDEDSWFVPNVVPLKVGELSTEQYNRILANFVEVVLAPAAAETAASFEMTKEEVHLRDIVGDYAAKALETFSSCANKSTGSSHPADQKRWFAFLVAVSRSESRLPTDLLTHALMEQGWTEDYAHKLSAEFEFAQDLLAYDKDH